MNAPSGRDRAPAAVRRILVVDDSISVQEAVRAAFADEPDIQVEVAGDLDAAEARLARRLPDLVLCDVVLPGRPGYELCAALKERPATRGLPVLLMSSVFEPFDADRARQAGADAVVGKPFTSAELRRLVHQTMAASPSRQVTDVEEGDLVPEPGAVEESSPTAELARRLVEPLAQRLAGPLADELERRLTSGPGPLAARVRQAVAATAERLVRRRLAELEEVATGDGTPRPE